jgi:long-chain acyl-CoA synthetase
MNTIIELFEHTVAQYPDHNFILENHGQGYRGMTFSEVHKTVLHLSERLIEMGVQPGDRVAILSENRAEWMLADLATIYTGAIVVTLSAKLIEGQDLLVRLQNSGAETIFVSRAQWPKIERLKAQTSLKRIFCFDDASYQDLLQGGHQPTQKARIFQPEPSTPALIIYTSGTTGMPKGVVLSHRACVAHTIKHQRIGDFRPDSCT